MSREKTQGIGFFEKYLTIWVLLCMAAGILIGKFLPGIPAFLGRFEYDVWLDFDRSDIKEWFTKANLSNIKIEDLNEQCCCDSCESCSSAAINIFIASAEKSSI